MIRPVGRLRWPRSALDGREAAHAIATGAPVPAVRLKDLAAHLSLSPTTVSRALAGYPDVSDRTRARVQDAATRLGYRAHTGARRLATGRSMTIGHVIPTNVRREMVNPIFADFLAGAGESYAAQGYAMRLDVVADDEETSVYEALAAEGAVDGFIVHSPHAKDARLDVLDRIALPFVVHGRFGADARPYSWLDVDNELAFRDAADMLLGLGHRRIALVNGPETQDFAVRRRRGFESAMRTQGISVDAGLMAADEMTESFGFASARAMLASADPPTAFVVASILSGIGVRRAISQAGHRMGPDRSVVIFDDDLAYLGNDGSDDSEGRPLFTAVRSSVREAGRRAARMLLDLVADRAVTPHAPHRTELLRAEVVWGRSTGAASGHGGGTR